MSYGIKKPVKPIQSHSIPLNPTQPQPMAPRLYRGEIPLQGGDFPFYSSKYLSCTRVQSIYSSIFRDARHFRNTAADMTTYGLLNLRRLRRIRADSRFLLYRLNIGRMTNVSPS